MFSIVLVPLDGGPAAETALPTASALARALGAQVSLLRVVRRPAALFDGHAAEIRDAAAYLDRLARDLAARGLRVQTHVRSGDAAESILAAIEEQRANLVVMATRGRAGIARAVLGSVAGEVLARGPVPVVLLRADSRGARGISRLLVPVDASEGGAFALEAAIDLARATRAQLTLLEVVAPVPAWAYAGGDGFSPGAYVDPEWEPAALAAARRHVDDLVAEARECGVPAAGLSMFGDVPETIARVATDISADLVVMSTRGRTGPARAVLGSVADAVVRQAEPPVLLVRYGSASAPAERGAELAASAGSPGQV